MRTKIVILNRRYRGSQFRISWNEPKFVVVKAAKRQIPNLFEKWFGRKTITETLGWVVLECISFVTDQDSYSGTSSCYWEQIRWFESLEDAQQFKNEVATVH